MISHEVHPDMPQLVARTVLLCTHLCNKCQSDPPTCRGVKQSSVSITVLSVQRLSYEVMLDLQ